MRAPSASELLEVWERGEAQGPVERALLLLAAASPEASADALARLSVGRRDGDLLALREKTFGPELTGVTDCPRCGERLEMSLRTADLRADTATAAPTLVSVDRYEIAFRPPNSVDLAALDAEPDAARREGALFERCIVAARRDGAAVAAFDLPSSVVALVEEHMARADPQADARLAMRCPACDHCWESLFDIVSFFWSEIEAWALRALHDVHVLASAYGWSESDILALSPRRRQFYLQKVGE